MTDFSTVDPKSIKIKGEFTSDPSICHFIVDRPVIEEWTLVFRSAEESLGSPMIDELFQVHGVSRVQVAGEKVTVTKGIDLDWPLLAREIVPGIRRGMCVEGGPISAAAIERIQSSTPEDLKEKIETLFESKINPALASHSGWVKLAKIENQDVYLEMGGGCQGCSASQQTLKNGIEGAIRDIAPGVRNIIDATDHDAGDNPYYK